MLRPEMNAKVSFHAAAGAASTAAVKSTALLVPKSALFQSDSKATVAVADNGHAVFKSVEVGDTVGDNVRIASGLSGSESVITGNPAALQNGQGYE